jgi:bifunctional N-acetylglucosamine-1-phosphate-uridyltransferase/glucosamine-1-phosphate-acetyltransferase GlmU-like protein
MIIIIMAGGLGKRMESDIPKVLHKVYGIFGQKNILENNISYSDYSYKLFYKPMISHVIDTSIKLAPKKIFIIVGKYKELIASTINEYLDDSFKSLIEYVEQPEALGTGHAIKCCLDYLKYYPNTSTLILSGDVPLISYDTIENLLKKPNSLLVTELDNPFGCGRIILSNNKVVRIVEEKDCNQEEKLIKLVNCGIYQINSNILLDLIPKITNNNKANEYYLTDLIELMIQHDLSIDYYELEKNKQYEIKNVNSKKDLEELNNFLLDLR